MERKILLIFSYCNTEEKIEVLSKNLEKIKELGMESFLYSPIILSPKIQKKCDYFFLTKENPVDQTKMVNFWSVLEDPISGKKVKLSYLWRDNSWGTMYQIKSLCSLSLSLDSNRYYIMAYDSILSEEVIQVIKSDMVNYCLPFGKRDENGNLVKYRNLATQLICLDRSFIEFLSKEITKEKYWTIGEAEEYLEKTLSSFPEFSFLDSPLIEDYICLFDNWGENLFNFSPTKDFKLFFTKGPKEIDYSPRVSLFFYGFSGEIEVKIKLNEEVNFYRIKSFDFVNLNLMQWEIGNLYIEYKGEIFDLVPSMSNIYLGGIEEI